jgi:hypothetical protein
LEDFRKSPKSKNLQKHIQILVREFKTAKQKAEKRKKKRKARQKKERRSLPGPQPIDRPSVHPNRSPAKHTVLVLG